MQTRSAFQGGIALVDRASDDASIRLLLVDDCRLRRDSVTEFLSRNATEVSRAWDMRSLCEEFLENDPEVIMVNMTTHGAESLLLCSTQLCSPSKVVAFGLSEDDEETVVLCVEAGVGGYHLRSESLDQLLAFVRKVCNGEPACSLLLSSILLRKMSESASQRAVVNDSLLTARESEVLMLLSTGMSNREIAGRLFIAVHTVKNHVHNLLTKLGVRSRAEAVALHRDTTAGSGSTTRPVTAVLPSSGHHMRNGSNSPDTSPAQQQCRGLGS